MDPDVAIRNIVVANIYEPEQSIGSLRVSESSSNSGMASPNEMLVDPDEYVVEPPAGEKEDEAIALFPDDTDGSTDPAKDLPPLANDCE
jgi:hypothetical protein